MKNCFYVTRVQYGIKIIPKNFSNESSKELYIKDSELEQPWLDRGIKVIDGIRRRTFATFDCEDVVFDNYEELQKLAINIANNNILTFRD